MTLWNAQEIQSTIEGQWINKPLTDSIAFDGVAIDSRSIKNNQFFFTFIGEQTDGHQYLSQAQHSGASLCIVTHPDRVPNDITIPVILVNDALDAITKLAIQWRSKLNATVIAITGSNGKTTTCRLMYSICKQAGSTRVSQKSFNNALGVPITILNTPIDTQYLVAELGTSSPGEISQRAQTIKPDYAIITSIGRAHLEELKDTTGVAMEKGAIVHSLTSNGTAVIPHGIQELDSALESVEQDCKIIRVDPKTAFKVIDIKGDTTQFIIDDQQFHLNMLGQHNVSNATMAIVAAQALGLDPQEIRDGIANAQPPEMRLERLEIPTNTKSILIYNDAYNANPDSVRAALETFDSMNLQEGANRVAILGSMLELGSQSDQEHRNLVDELNKYPSIDRFVLVGSQYPKDIDNPMISRFTSSNQETMIEIGNSITPGSCILLKGSRGIALEKIIPIIESNHPTIQSVSK
ncbi:MAG: UDP-N-acetylmuramoyl-tripeptide--D-alanyl-D-alanine ligase [Phycisphaerales bacterium]|nr:UDP-N-acetylmuramoyl-tripeptide--D-alanyl-D-alanine ligase [Phycisphaerales bacterium]